MGVQKTEGNTDYVGIKRVLRRLRGGSQSHLVEGEDGRFYVAKLAGNPQGNRTLVNEWIANCILLELGISTPSLCVLQLPSRLRGGDLYFELGDKRIPVQSEWHLGSVCPVNPETTVIFDFLPQKQLERVVNLEDFGKIFVVDQWLGQVDSRQAIFARDRSIKASQPQFRAHFIDQGMVFSGSNWELPQQPTQRSVYFNPMVYRMIDLVTICDQTVSRIEALTAELILLTLKDLPACWLSSADPEPLERLLQNLHTRRYKLRGLLTKQPLFTGVSAGVSWHAEDSRLSRMRGGCMFASPNEAQYRNY
jgi:hypothetical protein